ncbi:MAG: hypothetical protein E7580_00180 [Ruminococcaceae bacterium]|nr:hypothetical protein [Oscillospiraceae bacterium]
MDRKELTLAIKKLALELGADMVGIAPVSRFEGMNPMLRPVAHLPEAKSVVCLGIHHPDASVDWCGEPNPNFPAAFQIGMIPKLDAICFRMCKWLEKEGYPTVCQPCTTYWRHRKYKDIPYEHTAAWNHMPAFVAAGLGEYGYHGMVMSPEYGPRQRIISFITSAELESDELYRGDPLCDLCLGCAKHCAGQNYKTSRLNEPKFFDFMIEDKHFRYPNINRWRCFYGEQAHLDTNLLAEIEDMDEEKIYRSVEKGVRVPNHGYMCSSFKHCMTPKKRILDPDYAPGALRKKEKLETPAQTLLEKIRELSVLAGADRMSIRPLSDFEALKGNIAPGFRTEQFFQTFKTVITVGRKTNLFTMEGEFNRLNRKHLHASMVDRLSCMAIDVTRYLDDLGYEAIQDWNDTGFARKASEDAGWESEGERVELAAVICNIPFEPCTEILREWKDDVVPKLSPDLPIFENMDVVAVGSLEDVTFSGMDHIRENYPGMKSIVALAEALPERVVELAGAQEAEDGSAYAYAHYEIHKESIWAGVDLCSTLQAKGYRAIVFGNLARDVPPTIGKFGRHMPDLRGNAPFAAAAGLGSLGKSGLLIHPKYGPRLRYTFVLTDAPLTPTPQTEAVDCPEDCKLCASACPMAALCGETERIEIKKDLSFSVFRRDETRCAWARSLAMCEGVGSGQLGWKLPDIPVPEKLDEETIKRVQEQKDKIQTLCYQNPHFIDIVIERCLQNCPLGKTK